MVYYTEKKFTGASTGPGSFDGSSAYAPPDASSGSYLGKTLKIKGEITSDEILTVEGTVEGNLNISRTLTIGKDGHVEGEIKAQQVKIHGTAEGNVEATEKLEISSNGNFSGTVRSDTLVIEEGAVFRGKVNVEE